MDEILCNALNNYFNILSYTGYRSYYEVYKILVVQYIQELFGSIFKYYIADEDVKLMNELLYQLIGSTCEISFPSNCMCCCNKGNEAPTPVPSITNFKMLPDKTKYTGTQILVFTGASFSLSEIDQTVANSMQLWLDDEVIKEDMSFTENSTTIFPALSIPLPAGRYVFKLSVKGIDGNTYYSNNYVITVDEEIAPPTPTFLYMYTGNTESKPSVSEILAGEKYDYNTTKEFTTPKYILRTIWVCLPTSVTLLSMENTNFSDFLYNLDTGKNLMKSESVTINSESYTLYYLTTIPSRSPYKTKVK